MNFVRIITAFADLKIMINVAEIPVDSTLETLLTHLSHEEMFKLTHGELSFTIAELHAILVMSEGPKKLEILSNYHQEFSALGYDKEDILGIVSSKYLTKVAGSLLNNTGFLIADGLSHEYLVTMVQRLKTIKELQAQILQYQHLAASGQKRKSTAEKNKLYQDVKELGFEHQAIKRFANRPRAFALLELLNSHTAFLIEKGLSLNKISAYAQTPEAELSLNNLIHLLQLEKSRAIGIAFYDKCFDYATGHEYLARITRLLQSASEEDSNGLTQGFNQLAQYHDTIKCVNIFLALFERGFNLNFLNTLVSNRTNTILMLKLDEDIHALERMTFSREEISHYYSSVKNVKSLSKLLLCCEKLCRFRDVEPLITKLKLFREVEISIFKSFLDSISSRSPRNLIQVLEIEQRNPESFLQKLSQESRQMVLAIIPKVSIAQNSIFTPKETSKDLSIDFDSFELFEGFPFE